MSTLIRGCIVVGIVSLILGIISRIVMRPFFVEASAYLQFASFCLLAAITFLLYKMAYKIED